MLTILFAVAMLGCGTAATTATVKGKVTLADGSPLPGGRIDFRSPTSGQASGFIKGDGTYEAPAVPHGEQKVSIENSGLQGQGGAPAGIKALPGSDQRYMPINPMYTNPTTSGLGTTVSGTTHTYDIQIK